MKKICSLLLVLVILVGALASCTHIKGDDNKGSVFDVYLGSEIRNLDPAYAYNDKNAAAVLSLLFPNHKRSATCCKCVRSAFDNAIFLRCHSCWKLSGFSAFTAVILQGYKQASH